ncbi:MAG: NF038122 family metalloprotease [Acidobacteriota bacterium]
MKRHIPYAASGMRSALLWTVLGCLLIAGLASANFQPASAARSVVAQKHFQQVRKLRPAQPAAKAQADPQFTRFESGTVLEMHDGQLDCREATAAEAQALGRNHSQPLQVLSDEAFAPNAPGQAQTGLKIIMRGTQQLDQFPEAKAAFLRAARVWESLIQNPITVVIDVDYGPTFFGEPFDGYGGKTRSQTLYHPDIYADIRDALIKSAASPQEAALYNALPPDHLPTDQGPARGMTFTTAELRALGEISPVADPEHEPANWGLPPRIAFNSALSFDFDQSDGIKLKRADFTATAIHEIGHALGFDSNVGRKELHLDLPPTPALSDIFRFRPGVTSATFGSRPRVLSSGGEQVFFGGGAELPLSTGRSDASGGDGRLASHWKDLFLSQQYLGIMDPLTLRGYRYEPTNHDREAIELFGYRTNPLPNPREAELKLDDGTWESGALADGLIVVNRLTPPSYPATLRKLRIMVPLFDQVPDPAGQPITLWIGTQNNANGQPPPGDQFTRIETTVPSAGNQMFLEFTIPNGPTINAGDFYVGYQAPSPNLGMGFAIDENGATQTRSFYSEDNGASFAPITDEGAPPANTLIRALVAIGPEPTPAPTPVPTPTPTPGPAIVALTSGVPQDQYMVRFDPYLGWASGTQYTIQVPNGATELKIELDANTDMDFCVRFGSRVGLEGGYLTTDFKVESDAYRETLTITPASSPALRAGLYYVMVINYGPGPATFKITATVTGGGPPPGRLANISAATFKGEELAGGMIVAAFGEKLATGTTVGVGLPTTLLGTTVKVFDGQGAQRTAQLFFVSPTQVNYLMPSGMALGTATVTVTNGDGAFSNGTVVIEAVAPGLFTANGDGQGAPAAVVMRIKPGADPSYEPVAQYDAAQRRFVPRPIDLGRENETVALVLFGTGLRNRPGLSSVSLKLGGVDLPVQYAGAAPGNPGTDQINAALPRSLIGRGEMDLALVVNGKTANTVKLNIK